MGGLTLDWIVKSNNGQTFLLIMLNYIRNSIFKVWDTIRFIINYPIPQGLIDRKTILIFHGILSFHKINRSSVPVKM